VASEFAFLADLARTAVDAVHGEDATLKPMDRARGPHGAAAPSASRHPAPLVVAFYQDTEFAARRRAQPLISQSGERLLNRSPEIFGSTGYAGDIAVGDKILRDDTGDLFEVVTIDPDGIGNRILGLVHIKG
jgi:hypothetical protein